APAGISNLPNAVDPRGLMTFAVSGVATLVAAWLIVKGGTFPRRLGYLGAVTGMLLILVYLGRLIILNPKNPAVLTAAILTGFVGAIVAITRTGGHVLVNPGRLLAITSGLLAIWALAEEVLVHGSEIFPGPLPHFGPRIHQAQAHGHADIDDRIDG